MSDIYSLDTNILIDLIHEDKNVVSFLDKISAPAARLAVCSIAYYELKLRTPKMRACAHGH